MLKHKYIFFLKNIFCKYSLQFLQSFDIFWIFLGQIYLDSRQWTQKILWIGLKALYFLIRLPGSLSVSPSFIEAAELDCRVARKT